ncbi:MAG: MmgE/PrpD family protein, partial [Bacillota bacterium]
MTQRSVIAELAHRVVAAPPAGLPGEALEAARLCLLDALGCGLYGSTLADGRAVIGAVRALGGAGAAPVWGTHCTLSADAAALVDGALCHLRELDDVHYTITHPGAVCVPAGLAVAHLAGASLGDLLVALVLGYEVMAAVSRSVDYVGHRQLGWHGTATCGAFGSAAAAACLLGLNEGQTTWALGLAGSRTGGTWAFKADGAMSKRLHPGLAARDGVLAAFLAREGVTGPAHILEAEDGGLLRVMSRGGSPEAALAAWGDPWAVCETEFKLYAACKSVHAPLEAARKIHLQTGRGAGEVASVRVEVNSTARAMAGQLYDPGNVMSAQLSIPYGVAIALVGEEGRAASYTEERVRSREIYDLA